MKVKLLKDHDVLGKEHDVVEVTPDQANYLRSVEAAKDHTERKEEKSTIQTKEEKHKGKTK